MKKFMSAALILMASIVALPPPALCAAPALSADGLYNQGNAYARAGQPGLAVLNYERAQLLKPGDDDLAANLHAVRSAQHLSSAPPSWLRRFTMWPNPSWAALSGMLGLVLLGLSVLFARRMTRSRRVIIAAAGAALMGLTAGQAVILWPSLHAGVVVAQEAPVLVSPVPLGAALFVLPEAETVTLSAEHDDYVLIRTADGRAGWVLGTKLARVVTAEH